MNISHKYSIFSFLLFLKINLCFAQINSIPGLVLWLNSDSIYTSGLSKVDTVYDLSSLKNHAIQPNTTKQPTSLTSSILNGHKILSFDGIDDYVSFNEINSIRTVFWVIKENAAATSNYRSLLGHTILYPFYRGLAKQIWNTSFTSNSILTGNTAINSNSVIGTSALVPTQFSIISLITTSTVSADNFSDDRLLSGFVWDGELAELIIYNQALTPAQVSQVENYLNNKYAPPIVLPADIVVLNSYCDTIIKPINPNNNQYTNYNWSTGASTPTISVNKTGKYWVNATNIFGRVSTDTIVVNFPNYNQPSQSIICTGNLLLWNTQLPKNQYSFLWQDNTTTDSLFTINTPGNYFVRITDQYSCTITTNTVTVTQDNFSTQASLGPDVSLCAGNAIALTTGTLSANSYTWSDGSHANSLVVNTTGQYLVAVTNTNSCIAKDTINVTILGQAPVANYTTSVGCKNVSVLFNNLSTAPVGNSIISNAWDFGDMLSASNTSTLSNPFHTFSDTGNYSVKLKVITNAGCEQTIIKSIHIAAKPTVNFSNGISCQNDSTSFTNLSISSMGYSITALKWNFGDVSSGLANTSSLVNPKHLFSNQSTYSVKLIATNNAGCKDSISKNIAVKAQVKSIFSYSAACTNEVIKFQDVSIVPAPNSTNVRNWNFGSSTATGTLASHSYTVATIYSVTLTVTGNNGCNSTSVKQVTVTLPPACNFVTPTNFCINDSTKLTDASIGSPASIVNWKWSVNTITYSSIQSPYLHVVDTGNHVIKLRVIDALGCRDSASKNVYTYPLPIVDFTTTPSYIFSNTSALLTPTILSGLSYSWTGSNSFSSSSISPTYQFGDTGTYQINLALTNNRGCKGSKSKSIVVYNKKTDLAILDILPVIQVDGYLDLTVSLANFGTTTITDFKINYKLTNGGQIKETWTGVLNSGTFYNYHFSGSSLVNDLDKNTIVCVTISQVNGNIDDNTQNNNQCLALFVNDLDVFSPYPNPTSNNIVFPVVLKKETEIVFEVTNALGQSVLNNKVVGSPGLNLIPLSVSGLSSGCYVVKIIINDKLFIKKITKF